MANQMKMMKLKKTFVRLRFDRNSTMIMPITFLGLLTIMLCASFVSDAWAVVLHVGPDGDDQNPGTASLPLSSIQTALNMVSAGDHVFVYAGTYEESLRTRAPGSVGQPIVVSGSDAGAVVVIPKDGTALRISHPNYIIENLVFDGDFSKHDVVRVVSNGDGLIFRRNLVQNGAKDGIDLGNVATSVEAGFDYLENVIVADSTFRNFLAKDFFGNRIDAHGIVAGGVRGLTIRNTTVEMVSGDALQVANGNWDDVTVESVVFRNFPVSAEIAAKTGFAEGVNPGENAIDTKQDSTLPVRGRMIIRRSEFRGWGGDLIFNSAALNLKEKVVVTVDRCVFTENEIAMRLRGGGQSHNGATVEVSNSVFYANEKALRLEDNLLDFTLIHNSFGAGNAIFIETAGGGAGAGFEAANNVFFAKSLPKGVAPHTNLALIETDFVDVSSHDYRLTPSSIAVDSATLLGGYAIDHVGRDRPQGDAADFGAFERLPEVLQMPTMGWYELIVAPTLFLVVAKRGAWSAY